jgi:NAD-dependent SIR2 family protein deacetylase
MPECQTCTFKFEADETDTCPICNTPIESQKCTDCGGLFDPHIYTDCPFCV